MNAIEMDWNEKYFLKFIILIGHMNKNSKYNKR